jgi:hypothetical protein
MRGEYRVNWIARYTRGRRFSVTAVWLHLSVVSNPEFSGFRGYVHAQPAHHAADSGSAVQLLRPGNSSCTPRWIAS